MESKCSKNASGVTGVSKCGLKVAMGGQGAPKGAKKVPKTRPGAPQGMPFGHLGLQTRTFAKHRYLLCKTYICTPGELLQDTRANHSDLPGTLIAKMGTKVMQKVPGGRHRSARGGHLSAQGAKRCPKR